MSTSSIDELRAIARKYCLLNAILHNGKAELGSVVGRILAERAELRKEAKTVKSVVQDEMAKVNSLAVHEQVQALNVEFPQMLKKEAERKRQVSEAESRKIPSLPDLPEARRGAVVTRFPPEPNGYMHIGHAKAATIGFEYAKKYEGKFILRFDDTNPSVEKKEYYSAFLESLKWLGIVPDVVKNASDDMEEFYRLAEKMIIVKRAYVCTCSQEEMRENRSLGRACSHRDRSPEENLDQWTRMLSRKMEKSSATIRFMGDMQSLNTTMRDPVLFRIIEEPHPIKGTSYVMWPTYDFDGPVEDSLDGVTHAMRSKEYELRDELYHSILRALGLREPRIIEFSRLSLQNTTVSKRNLRKLIEEGHIGGWDDPRLPTIAGLRRRGFLPEAIKEFILEMGVSKVESEPTWDLLESINRRRLDPLAKRYFFVADPVRVKVARSPELTVKLKYHPDKDYGVRSIRTNGEFYVSRTDVSQLHEGSKFRLIEAYNAKVIEIQDDLLLADYEGDEVKSTQPMLKLQWVAADNKTSFEVKVIGPLLLEGVFNPKSMNTARGFAEESAAELRTGELVQFVRFGFARIDSPGVAIIAHK